MWPIATGRVVWSLGRFVTIVSPAKTAEPNEMPFGVWTWVDTRNNILDKVQIPTFEGATACLLLLF